MHHQIRGRLHQVQEYLIVSAMLVFTAGMEAPATPVQAIQFNFSIQTRLPIESQLAIVTLDLRDRMQGHVQAVTLENTKVRLAMRDAPRVLPAQVHLLVVPYLVHASATPGLTGRMGAHARRVSIQIRPAEARQLLLAPAILVLVGQTGALVWRVGPENTKA